MNNLGYICLCVGSCGLAPIACTSNDNVADDDDSATTGGVPSDFASLEGNDFVLAVDRRLDHPDIQSPPAMFQEADYETNNDGVRYPVHFSDDLDTVVLEDPETVTGIVVDASATQRWYDLTDGLFAGGRFMVWPVEGGFEAEYTIYGSGLPILSSERGSLVPSNK